MDLPKGVLPKGREITKLMKRNEINENNFKQIYKSKNSKSCYLGIKFSDKVNVIVQVAN